MVKYKDGKVLRLALKTHRNILQVLDKASRNKMELRFNLDPCLLSLCCSY